MESELCPLFFFLSRQYESFNFILSIHRLKDHEESQFLMLNRFIITNKDKELIHDLKSNSKFSYSSVDRRIQLIQHQIINFLRIGMMANSLSLTDYGTK